MRKNGFTIVELIIVVVIITVLALIGGFQMRSWLGKARVEEVIKQMHMDIVNARALTMSRSRVHFVRVQPNQYEIWEDTSPNPDGNGTLETASDDRIDRMITRETLQGLTSFQFDTNGIASSSGTIRMTNAYGSICDCIAVSLTRIRLGRWNGANCT